jgi:hemerythrin-like domain-containing protein
MSDIDLSRRKLMQAGSLSALGLLSAPLLLAQSETAKPKQKKEEEEGEVTPTEDLMREHGLLKRVLLIYDEVIRRIHAKQEFSPQVVGESAQIIRNFIESYHEKLEEEHLFPRFRKAGKLVELVDVLQKQHQAGRAVTARIITLAAGPLKAGPDQARLADQLHSFVRMYEPHEAREDTILFPALRSIVSDTEYDAMGEDFEKKEHQLFGEEGFEGQVQRVAELEKKLGIFDLAQFTPK